jgi:hypothetical protein
MFVKVKSTVGNIKMININQIDNVAQGQKTILIETKSIKVEVEGNLESFAKTLLDIMTTQRIMWYVYYEKE